MRLFGILLLSAVPVLLGIEKRRKLLLEGKEKAAMLRFFEFLRFRIETFTQPQKKIFLDFSEPILENNGFLDRLRLEVEQKPVLALFRCIKESDKMGFSDAEWESVLEFAENFGMQSKKTQLQDLEKLLSFLKKEEEKRGPERQIRANLVRTAGLCTGLGILIILL